MPRRRKPADPQSRGAEETEIQPQFINDATSPFVNDATSPFYNRVDGITVPSDSTEDEPQEKELLAIILASKYASVTELTEEGRGLRLYLGKPSMGTFETMLRRSKGVGIVIEPDPRQEGVAVEWRKAA